MILKDELRELAERVEAATDPDRNLDAMIHARNGLEGVGHWQDAPAFTASLDAAMQLVPEGYWWTVGRDTDFAWAALTQWGADSLDARHVEANNCPNPRAGFDRSRLACPRLYKRIK